MNLRSIFGACAVASLALGSPARAGDRESRNALAGAGQVRDGQADDLQADDPGDLADLSIEELARIKVTSASKREEPLSEAATALYVITSDDIVESGATALPEILRLAPNLQVQQIDASQYAISARGFNGAESANKLLVLIDGRSIYTPLASSVFWNLHSPLVEDLQQVEVISGPGGTLYGPNAVNGVVSITRRDSRDTIGTLARGTAGADERTVGLRQGFALGDSGAARIYANWHDRDGLPAGTGAEIDDDYRGWQAGFRSDFGGGDDHFTLQGDVYRTQAATIEGDGAKGHNILGRWTRAIDPTTSFRLQAYTDSFKREFLLVSDSVRTFDAEAQLTLDRGAHDLVVGGGVRTTRDEFINALNVFHLDPESRRLWVFNGFAQDKIALNDALSLTVGAKVERSSFTGLQFLPNARIAWHPGPDALLWAAVSRAVRTPSRIDRELTTFPELELLAKSDDFVSEKLVAVEAGYRGAPVRGLNLSVSGFVNFYDDLRTTELTDGGLPIRLLNGSKGKTYGIEAWANTQVAPWWRLWVGTATLWKDLGPKDGHLDLAPRNTLGNDPNWQIQVRSDFELAPRLRLTLNGRAVGPIELSPADAAPDVDGYVEAGGRLAYRIDDRIELFVAGRNLLHRTHIENNDPAAGQAPKRVINAGVRLSL